MRLLNEYANNNAIPNGINTFSGYMKTKTASGTAVTAARSMTFADTGLTMNGIVQGRLLGSSSGTTCVSGSQGVEITSRHPENLEVTFGCELEESVKHS